MKLRHDAWPMKYKGGSKKPYRFYALSLRWWWRGKFHVLELVRNVKGDKKNGL